jgi:hypothetical protein
VRLKALRRRCENLVARIGVPEPFDELEFVARVAQLRGRPIELAAMATGIASPCGLWIATDQADLIFYADGTSAPHQQHIVVHELGHLMFDHEGEADQQRWADSFPDLDVDLVRRVLARSTVSLDEEREAEMFATVVLSTAWRRRDTAPAMPHQFAGRDSERLARLVTALEPAEE